MDFINLVAVLITLSVLDSIWCKLRNTAEIKSSSVKVPYKSTMIVPIFNFLLWIFLKTWLIKDVLPNLESDNAAADVSVRPHNNCLTSVVLIFIYMYMKTTLRVFQDDTGKSPYIEWIESLDIKAKARIMARVDRLRVGNFGDCESVGDGVFELRVHFGPGYRIYFGKIKNTVVLLLLGGSKKSQKKDINKAKNYWRIFQERRKK